MKAKLVEELKKIMAEKDPNGKNPHQSGAKLDAGKSPVFRGLLDYFPRALMSIAEVSEVGSKKYCWKGWETVEDGINRYSDALLRHMCKDSLGEERDIDTNLLHKAHTAWGALAVLELYLREQEEQKEAKLGNQGSAAFTRKEFGSDPNLSMGL